MIGTDRVDDVGRGHLRDHGHDVDERDALAPHAGRHNLQYSAVQYSAAQYSTQVGITSTVNWKPTFMA